MQTVKRVYLEDKICALKENVLTCIDLSSDEVLTRHELYGENVEIFATPSQHAVIVLKAPTAPPAGYEGTQELKCLDPRPDGLHILWVTTVPKDAQLRIDQSGIYVSAPEGFTYVLNEKTGDKVEIHLRSRVYRFEGDVLLCQDSSTNTVLFREQLAHPEFVTLQDLTIKELHVAPDGRGLIVLFHLTERGYKTVGNVLRTTLDGEIMWWAELTDTGFDTYVGAKVSSYGIRVNSMNGYSCQIDEQTGKIIERRFTK